MRRARPGEHSARTRVGLTAVDQLVSSASNFIVGAIVGRISGAASLGAFAVTFMAWLVCLGLHRALITEPTMISGRFDAHGAEGIRRGQAAEIALGCGFGIVVACGAIVVKAIGGHEIGTALLVLAPLLPVLLLQDYWRAVAYFRREPHKALVNDVAFTAMQLALFALFISLGAKSTSWFLLAWGLGAGVGAVLGFVQFSVRPLARGGVDVIRTLWPNSRWLAADFTTQFLADQAYLLLVVVIVGKFKFGGLRAASSLMGPANVILISGGNLGLPGLTRALRDHGRDGLVKSARRLTEVVVAGIALYAVVVSLLGSWLLRVVYQKQEYAKFTGLISLQACQYVIGVFAFGVGISLRVTNQTRRLWLVRISVSALSFALVWPMTRWFGLQGALWAGAIASAAGVSGAYVVFHRYLRSSPVGPTVLLDASGAASSLRLSSLADATE